MVFRKKVEKIGSRYQGFTIKIMGFWSGAKVGLIRKRKGDHCSIQGVLRQICLSNAINFQVLAIAIIVAKITNVKIGIILGDIFPLSLWVHRC